ncbi:hypothetical protein MHBO_001427, partial [Bonamia ostreae]
MTGKNEILTENTKVPKRKQIIDEKGENYKKQKLSINPPKVSDEEEARLLNLPAEERVLQLNKMDNKDLLEAVTEVISLKNFEMDNLVLLGDALPESARKEAIAFCSEVYKQKMIVQRRVKEINNQKQKIDEKEKTDEKLEKDTQKTDEKLEKDTEKIDEKQKQIDEKQKQIDEKQPKKDFDEQ